MTVIAICKVYISVCEATGTWVVENVVKLSEHRMLWNLNELPQEELQLLIYQNLSMKPSDYLLAPTVDVKTVLITDREGRPLYRLEEMK